jgi:hypothetical protein
MCARSLKRLMERATIHSDVGVINGLRLPIFISLSAASSVEMVTPPVTLRAKRLECDDGALWQSQ